MPITVGLQTAERVHLQSVFMSVDISAPFKTAVDLTTVIIYEGPGNALSLLS